MRRPRLTPPACRPSPAAGVALLLLLAAGVGPAASARPLALAVTPEPATWADPVTLAVTLVACPLVSLDPTVDATQRRIDVELLESCDGAQPTQQTIEQSLGRLGEGSWTVTVHDRSQGGAAGLGFVVFDVLDAEPELPALATDATPVKITVPALGFCPLFDWRVDGRVVTLLLGGEGCTVAGDPEPEVLELVADLGLLPAGDYEVRVWGAWPEGDFVHDPPRVRRAPLRVWRADGCLPGDAALCLRGGRFRLEAAWRDFAGNAGAAHATALPDSDQSGLLWFFAEDNAELTLKVLSGCGLNDHWWVFVSSSSTVEYDVVVTDTLTGVRRTYHHPAGEAAPLLADTSAFACP